MSISFWGKVGRGSHSGWARVHAGWCSVSDPVGPPQPRDAFGKMLQNSGWLLWLLSSSRRGLPRSVEAGGERALCALKSSASKLPGGLALDRLDRVGSQALLANQLDRARLRERLAWHNTKPKSGARARARGVRLVPGVPIWDTAWLDWLGDGG